MFVDRHDAAIRLAERLRHWRGKQVLVLAIPRGAVPMGDTLARALEGELDVVLARKLPAPHQSEFAVGAVDEGGWMFVGDEARQHKLPAQYLEQQRRAQLATISKRRAQYTPLRERVNPAGRVVVLVDDGLATGATMTAALHAVRQAHPKRLICAVPVAPADTLARIRGLADEVVCLQTPDNFEAVGQFYRDFPQVSDEEVVEVLQRWGGRERHFLSNRPN